MAATFFQITQDLLAIVQKSPNGIGWYGAEMRCSIPRSDFPGGMNVAVVLEAMTEAGALMKRGVDGKEKYFVSDSVPRVATS
jgi:hypothetical protein